jgi:CubicO group peptidase (beta-lactamase class C family)
MTYLRWFLIIVVSYSILQCAQHKSADRAIGSLDVYFQKQFPEDEPGGAVLIMKGERALLSKGYGIADIKTREPITPNTLFNLGSISKTFVASAILKLQEENKLSVEDSLFKYFPEFKNSEIAKKVRIKHLLTHTSGLPDNREVSKDTVFYLTAKDAENWAPVMKTDSLVFEPGSRYEYSNPAFNALALIVEKVSGMKWQDYIIKNIMQPSEMNASTITDGPHPESGVSHGYVGGPGHWIEDDYGEEPTFPASGNGGVWSSVEELRLYELALRKATFLKKETIEDARTVKTFHNWSDSIPPAIGWSWFVGKTKDGLKTVGHTGSQGGFLCDYISVPEKQILVVVLCNTPRNVPAFSEEIMDVLQQANWLENDQEKD